MTRAVLLALVLVAIGVADAQAPAKNRKPPIPAAQDEQDAGAEIVPGVPPRLQRPGMALGTAGGVGASTGVGRPARPANAEERRPAPRSANGNGVGTGTAEIKDCPAGKMRMDFTDADIRDIVKTISEMSGRNFMIDKNVAGKITLISPTCVTKEEAYNTFLAVLEVNGLTVVKQGLLHKIVQKANIIQRPLQTYMDGEGASSTADQYVTQMIPLANISVDAVQAMFSEFISPDGRMLAYTPSNTLIVVDTQANIARLLKILKKLDVEGIEETIDVIELLHAPAQVVAEQITMLFPELAEGRPAAVHANTRQATTPSRPQVAGRPVSPRVGGGDSGGGTDREQVTSIIPDLRTNSLIVRANKHGIKKIRELIEKLDVPVPGGEGAIHVYYLQNVGAEEIAGTLQALAGGGGAGGGTSRQAGGTTSQSGSGQRGGNLQKTIQGMGGAAGAAAALAGGLGALGGGSSLGGGGVGGIGGGGAAPVAEFEGGVRITADRATNSLVIVAGNRDYELLKQVIEKLDIRRRQVFVEAMILEITLEKSRQLGFEFRSTNDPASSGGIQGIGGTNFGNIAAAASNPLGVTGLAIGAVDGTISFGGQTFPNIGALFTALKNDNDVNVLSTPTLLTTDNQQAEIVVADNIPFVTGQLFSQANNNPVTTIERQDVGITLRITPQINDSNRVTMILEQEVSNVTNSPEGLAAANVGVTTSKRSAKTVVVVHDRQTVAIGGLMKDNIGVAETKVPLLGDIPILGYFFKNSKRTSTKTNLLLFLTPYVVRDEKDFEEVTRMKYEQWKQFKADNQVIERKGTDFGPKEQNMTGVVEEKEGQKEFELRKPERERRNPPPDDDSGDDEPKIEEE